MFLVIYSNIRVRNLILDMITRVCCDSPDCRSCGSPLAVRCDTTPVLLTTSHPFSPLSLDRCPLHLAASLPLSFAALSSPVLLKPAKGWNCLSINNERSISNEYSFYKGHVQYSGCKFQKHLDQLLMTCCVKNLRFNRKRRKTVSSLYFKNLNEWLGDCVPFWVVIIIPDPPNEYVLPEWLTPCPRWLPHGGVTG